MTASQSSAESQGPWVEFGTGWAKVHFRRDVTDADRAWLLGNGLPSREVMAETIHNARWPADRQLAVTPFADEDRNGREYCFRIADAVRAALASQPEQPSGHAQAPVAYVPLSQMAHDKGEPMWREVFAAKWRDKDVWNGFDLRALYFHPSEATAALEEIKAIVSNPNDGPEAMTQIHAIASRIPAVSVTAADLFPLFRDAASVNMTEDAVERQAWRLAEGILSRYDVRPK
jgi:hypothetical protein